MAFKGSHVVIVIVSVFLLIMLQVSSSPSPIKRSKSSLCQLKNCIKTFAIYFTHNMSCGSFLCSQYNIDRKLVGCHCKHWHSLMYLRINKGWKCLCIIYRDLSYTKHIFLHSNFDLMIRNKIKGVWQSVY